jgi:hypothetical protein
MTYCGHARRASARSARGILAAVEGLRICAAGGLLKRERPVRCDGAPSPAARCAPARRARRRRPRRCAQSAADGICSRASPLDPNRSNDERGGAKDGPTVFTRAWDQPARLTALPTRLSIGKDSGRRHVRRRGKCRPTYPNIVTGNPHD